MTSSPARPPRAAAGVQEAQPKPASLERGPVQLSSPREFRITRREGEPLPDRSRIEWLLTDGYGGMAMGTVEGIPTRRYHAWHIPALHPPVGRAVLLHSVVERVVVLGESGERAYELASYRFAGDVTHPRGGDHLVEFRKSSASAAWTYLIRTDGGEIEITRELALTGPASAAVAYRFASKPSPSAKDPPIKLRIELRPLLAMRDFHSLASGALGRGSQVTVSTTPGVVAVRRTQTPQGSMEIPQLQLAANSTTSQWCFSGPSQWWHDFEYHRDRDRGQDFREDLFSPGMFVAESTLAPCGQDIRVDLHSWIGGDPGPTVESAIRTSADRVAAAADFAARGVQAPELASAIGTLAAAADQFVVRRCPPPWKSGSDRSGGASVIAGYPWFSDWGRDAMISLPGLLLSTGRLEEARTLLEGFAGLIRGGLIPNCFDNGTGEAEYNTVDASLWFVHAASSYFRAGPTRAAVDGPILTASLSILDAYQHGTELGIRVDPADGLVSAGDQSTQLTWMDARRNGVVFTPRAGKAVEINALWYNALAGLAEVLENLRPRTARDLRQFAERVRTSFQARFFDAYRQMCFDLVPGSSPGHVTGNQADPAYQVRPNQIFAVSLPHSPLNAEQQQAVVRSVRQALLTPMGLRTLISTDRDYQGRYEGSLFARDKAYHNGTVWPWLLGPFAEAVMRVGQFSQASRSEARKLLKPLIDELLTPGPGRAIGQLAEVYDGDHTDSAPRRPDGCPAQAWSVAEVLRVLVMCGEK